MMKRYIKLRRSKIAKKILIGILLLVLSCLFFLRWTGYITNTPLNWKRPNVEYIDGKDNGIIQKNDQLWINLRFNKNHAQIKTAYVWVDNKENKKDLQPNSNTYIFKNLTSGTHDIGYELKWSLFGYKSATTTFDMSNLNTIVFQGLKRDETKVSVNLLTEGTFVENTLGLYYFDVNSYKKSKEEKEFNISDILVKQTDLDEGVNELTFDSVVDGNGNEFQFIDNPYRKYLLFGGGITQIDGKTYLVYSIPFYGFVWGTPSINWFYTTENEKTGTVTVPYLGIYENNFNNGGQEWLQFDFYYNDGLNWQIADQKLIEYQQFNRNGISFERILRDEKYFPIPTNPNDEIKYRIGVQLKYGYDLNEVPQIDDDPPNASNVCFTEFAFRAPQITIDDNFAYHQPNYYYEYDSSNQFERVTIDWNEGNWIDLPDKKSRISVEWRTKTIDGTIKQNWEILEEFNSIEANALKGETIIDSSFSNSIDPINGTIMELRINVQIPITNWWNDVIDYKVVPLRLNDILIKNK